MSSPPPRLTACSLSPPSRGRMCPPPPRLTACSLSPPSRGRHQRPGRMCPPPPRLTACSLSPPSRGRMCPPPPRLTACSLSPPSRGRHQRPGGAGSAVPLVGASLRLPERGHLTPHSSLLRAWLLLQKVNHPSASTACPYPTRNVSAANKQPARGERSERAVRHRRGSRSGRAVWYSKPPLGRAEQRSSVRIKALALFERSEFASAPNAASSARDRVSGTDVARLFFGYFFLAKQKKVTRLPGRNPACPRSEEKQAQQTPQKPRAAKNLSLLAVPQPPWARKST